MTSRSRSGTTTEKGARVFSKSSDDKENMTEIRKTEGGKQNKQELSRDEINGHENEEKKGQVSRRASLRKARVLSYKEPSIMSKLRRYSIFLPFAYTMMWCTNVEYSNRNCSRNYSKSCAP